VGIALRSWERFLKVDGWQSEYASVDRCLRHYGRKVRSEGTRSNVGLILSGFCDFCGKNPDGLVRLSSKDASKLVQDCVDSLAERGFSIRYVNVCLAYLKTFFKVNGFKGSRALEVERHYQPSRYRKREEYVPTSSEIYDMSLSAGSLRNKAVILALYTTGLRNSTLRALLYRDVGDELEKGLEIIKIPVYPEMKKIDVGACKGNIPYYSFMSKESTEALRAYVEERRHVQGSIEDDEPLYCADSSNMTAEEKRRTPMLKKSLEALVKNAARNAGLRKWKDVYPHCLRKAFESAIRNAGLDLKDQEFLMGHILPGTQDTYYDKTKVEDMRRKYTRIHFFPEKFYSSEDIRKKQIVDTAKLLGFPEERIRKIEEVLARHKRVDEALKEFKRFQEETESKTMTNGNGAYDIAKGETELIKRLHNGWKLVQPLNGEKYLLVKVG